MSCGSCATPLSAFLRPSATRSARRTFTSRRRRRSSSSRPPRAAAATLARSRARCGRATSRTRYSFKLRNRTHAPPRVFRSCASAGPPAGGRPPTSASATRAESPSTLPRNLLLNFPTTPRCTLKVKSSACVAECFKKLLAELAYLRLAEAVDVRERFERFGQLARELFERA